MSWILWLFLGPDVSSVVNCSSCPVCWTLFVITDRRQNREVQRHVAETFLNWGSVFHGWLGQSNHGSVSSKRSRHKSELGVCGLNLRGFFAYTASIRQDMMNSSSCPVCWTLVCFASLLFSVLSWCEYKLSLPQNTGCVDELSPEPVRLDTCDVTWVCVTVLVSSIRTNQWNVNPTQLFSEWLFLSRMTAKTSVYEIESYRQLVVHAILWKNHWTIHSLIDFDSAHPLESDFSWRWCRPFLE